MRGKAAPGKRKSAARPAPAKFVNDASHLAAGFVKRNIETASKP